MNAPFWRENTHSPLQHFSILIGQVLEVWRIHQDDWLQYVIVADMFNAFRSQSPLEAWVRIPLLTVCLALTCGENQLDVLCLYNPVPSVPTKRVLSVHSPSFVLKI